MKTVRVTHGPVVKVQASANDRKLGFSTFRYVILTVPRDIEFEVGSALRKLGHHVSFRTINGPCCVGTKVIDPKGLPNHVEIPS